MWQVASNTSYVPGVVFALIDFGLDAEYKHIDDIRGARTILAQIKKDPEGCSNNVPKVCMPTPKKGRRKTHGNRICDKIILIHCYAVRSSTTVRRRFWNCTVLNDGHCEALQCQRTHENFVCILTLLQL